MSYGRQKESHPGKPPIPIGRFPGINLTQISVRIFKCFYIIPYFHQKCKCFFKKIFFAVLSAGIPGEFRRFPQKFQPIFSTLPVPALDSGSYCCCKPGTVALPAVMLCRQFAHPESSALSQLPAFLFWNAFL